MPRVAMTRILQSSARFNVSSTAESRLRRVIFDQPNKYDRHSLYYPSASLDIVSGPSARPVTPSRSGYSSGRSIHDTDSWNWTSVDVSWLHLLRTRKDLSLSPRFRHILNVGAQTLQYISRIRSIGRKWPSYTTTSFGHLGTISPTSFFDLL